jgi:ABC-type multidrug transport system fused ATPase/permease subunit
VLTVERGLPDPEEPAPEPAAEATLEDPASGLVVQPGELVGLASDEPHDIAALADRLGGFAPGARLGDTPLTELARDVVRRRILVSEADPILFAGTLRGELDPWHRSTDEEILDAVGVANAEDIVEALPDGLDGEVEERGRSFSGGQRQRLVLARAILSRAPILVLVEPTSAVDAHTEARIAQRLREARAGRTTVAVTTSPLVLDLADRVVLVRDGRVADEGTHRELLRRSDEYREVVTRGEER